MDKSREQFEEFAKDDMWLERMRDGSYKSSVTRKLWDCWQASRAALVVQLPATCCRTLVFEIACTSEVGMEHDEYYEPDELHEALDSAGVKYK